MTYRPSALAAACFLSVLADPAVALSPIVVTAGRIAQTAEDSLASITVIDRQQIEKQQAHSVPDLLRGVPGVSLTNNGGAGKLTSVLLRGTESDHVLVLIDGVKVGSASAGVTAFEHLPVEQIERIEIVRGPRSSLYGSEAIGGVIQIFTRRGGGELSPWFSLGGGSFDSYKASAGISGGGDNTWFSGSISGEDTEGFNACNGQPMVAGCFTHEPDKDGYDNLSGNLRAGMRFDGGAEVDVHWLRTEASTRYDGDYQNESDTMQQVFGAGLKLAPTADWSLSLKAGRSLDESDNFKDGTFSSRFETRRDSLSLQSDLIFGADQLLSLGLDYQDDRVGGSTAYAVTARDNKGIFGQYLGQFGGHDIQASLRRDDNEQFGGHTTGALAWGYEIAAGLRLIASYGTAFKAPSFDELYFPGFGNPDLEPESSRSLEIGLSGLHNWGNWSLNAYQTDIDDLIAFDASTYAPANIESARIRGLEAVVSALLGDWRLQAELTLLDPVNQGNGFYHDNTLPRRAEQSFRADVDRDYGRYSFGATLNAVGKRYDDIANSRELDSYLTFDLRAEYRLSEAWRLQARLDNLFDEEYETAAFYNQPGRSFFLTVRYQP